MHRNDIATPLHEYPGQARIANPELWTPRIELISGRDQGFGSFTLLQISTGEGREVIRKALVAKRWRNAPQSLEECLTDAYAGLRWYLGEAGISFE